MRFSSALVTLAVSALVLVSDGEIVHAKNAKIHYKVDVRRTSFGIPHVRASDWGSLGYGYGYAFAQDNICVLAGDVLVATGTKSRFFGPQGGNLASDFVFGLVNTDALIRNAWESLDNDTQDLLRGYADGYNRYLRDTGVDALAADCRGAAWVRPIDEFDMLKVLKKLTLRAGTANFISSLVGAVPPAVPVAKATGGAAMSASLARATNGQRAKRLLAAVELPDTSTEQLRQQRRRPRRRPHGWRRCAARQPTLPVVRDRALPRRPPDHSRPLRRDGLRDLWLPSREHRLQPRHRLEPHGLDGAALRGARAHARGGRPDILRLRRPSSSDDAGGGERRRAPGGRLGRERRPHLLHDAVRPGDGAAAAGRVVHAARVRPHGREPRERAWAQAVPRDGDRTESRRVCPGRCGQILALPWVNTIAADTPGGRLLRRHQHGAARHERQARRVREHGPSPRHSPRRACTRSTARPRSAISAPTPTRRKPASSAPATCPA